MDIRNSGDDLEALDDADTNEEEEDEEWNHPNFVEDPSWIIKEDVFMGAVKDFDFKSPSNWYRLVSPTEPTQYDLDYLSNKSPNLSELCPVDPYFNDLNYNLPFMLQGDHYRLDYDYSPNSNLFQLFNDKSELDNQLMEIGSDHHHYTKESIPYERFVDDNLSIKSWLYSESTNCSDSLDEPFNVEPTNCSLSGQSLPMSAFVKVRETLSRKCKQQTRITAEELVQQWEAISEQKHVLQKERAWMTPEVFYQYQDKRQEQDRAWRAKEKAQIIRQQPVKDKPEKSLSVKSKVRKPQKQVSRSLKDDFAVVLPSLSRQQNEDRLRLNRERKRARLARMTPEELREYRTRQKQYYQNYFDKLTADQQEDRRKNRTKQEKGRLTRLMELEDGPGNSDHRKAQITSKSLSVTPKVRKQAVRSVKSKPEEVRPALVLPSLSQQQRQDEDRLRRKRDQERTRLARLARMTPEELSEYRARQKGYYQKYLDSLTDKQRKERRKKRTKEERDRRAQLIQQIEDKPVNSDHRKAKITSKSLPVMSKVRKPQKQVSRLIKVKLDVILPSLSKQQRQHEDRLRRNRDQYKARLARMTPKEFSEYRALQKLYNRNYLDSLSADQRKERRKKRNRQQRDRKIRLSQKLDEDEPENFDHRKAQITSKRQKLPETRKTNPQPEKDYDNFTTSTYVDYHHKLRSHFTGRPRVTYFNDDDDED